MSGARLDFWFEFASTYSYLTAMRIETLAASRGVSIRWRPFLLGPIFADQGLPTSPFNTFPLKGDYMWRDMAREAARLGLPPVCRPDPFPQNGLLAARVAILADGQDWQAEFARRVFTAQFADGKNVADYSVLAGVLKALGQEPTLLDQARSDIRVKDRLRASTDEARAQRIFGAPSFTTPDGELFWGNDRLEAALDWVA